MALFIQMYFASLVVYFLCVVAEVAMASPARLPHIIFVVIDDLGSGDLGRSHSGIHTPNMDRLSSEGIYLDNYYVLPYCSPTRATFMTGRYPLHTGCHTIIQDYDTQGIPLDEQLLPQVLREVGYRAHAVGKWHLGHARHEQTPTFRGFESYLGFLHGHSDYYTHIKKGPVGDGYEMRRDNREFCGPGCTTMVDERGNYSTHVFTREAIRIIEEHHEQHKDDNTPLFLYLAHQAVHYPDEVPSEYVEKYLNRSDWTNQRKVYAGMLSAADESIANVTEALKANGMWENTILIGTTDNGGPTDICMVQGSSNGNRRGGKCTVWEGGTTGDAFVVGPALESVYGISPSQVYSGLFHAVDWLSTLANMTGAVPMGKPLDGVNHLSQWQRKGKLPAREELFIGYAEFHGNWYGPSIKWKDWKLLQGTSGGPESATGPIPEGSDHPDEGGSKSAYYLLFDLKADPEERHDVSQEHPIIVQLLKEKLAQYHESFVPPIPNDPNCPFPGLHNTSTFGPTWMPWCEGASEVVFST